MKSNELMENAQEETDAQTFALTIAGVITFIGLALLFIKKRLNNKQIRSVPPIIIKTGGYTRVSGENLIPGGYFSIDADDLSETEPTDGDRYYYYRRQEFGYIKNIDIQIGNTPYHPDEDQFGLSTALQLEKRNASGRWINAGQVTIKNEANASGTVINFVLKINMKLTRNPNQTPGGNPYQWDSDPTFFFRITRILVEDSYTDIKLNPPPLTDSKDFTIKFN